MRPIAYPQKPNGYFDDFLVERGTRKIEERKKKENRSQPHEKSIGERSQNVEAIGWP
jgi:hypothetical protein